MTNFHELVNIRRGNCTPEIFQMKADLRKWGRSTQLLNEMNWEIKNIEKLIVSTKKDEEKLQKETVKSLLMSYQERIDNLKKETAELVGFSNKMDAMVSALDSEEQMFLRMRYKNGAGFDSICRKMCMSRATVFRFQKKCILHIMDNLSKSK